jgi:hypothetical protein
VRYRCMEPNLKKYEAGRCLGENERRGKRQDRHERPRGRSRAFSGPVGGGPGMGAVERASLVATLFAGSRPAARCASTRLTRRLDPVVLDSGRALYAMSAMTSQIFSGRSLARQDRGDLRFAGRCLSGEVRCDRDGRAFVSGARFPKPLGEGMRVTPSRASLSPSLVPSRAASPSRACHAASCRAPERSRSWPCPSR